MTSTSPHFAVGSAITLADYRRLQRIMTRLLQLRAHLQRVSDSPMPKMGLGWPLPNSPGITGISVAPHAAVQFRSTWITQDWARVMSHSVSAGLVGAHTPLSVIEPPLLDSE